MKKSSRLFAAMAGAGLLLGMAFVGCGSNVPAAFDVPALVGSDINGVAAKLGKPSQDEPPNAQVQQGMAASGDREWSKNWTHDGHDLLVTYNMDTGRIADFFIATDDTSGETSDKDRLMALGNLREGAANYRVEFVPTASGTYTGVKAIPQ